MVIIPVKLFSKDLPRNFLSFKTIELFIFSTNAGISAFTPCTLVSPRVRRRRMPEGEEGRGTSSSMVVLLQND